MENLRLSLLGNLDICRLDVPVTGFTSRKVPALLCYLAVTGRPHLRPALAGLLWGEQPDLTAQAYLRKALTNLHQLVGPYVVITRETVAFNRDSSYWLDVEAFEARTGRAAETVGIEPLQEAVDLYRGDFLEGFYLRDAPGFEEWALGQRARFRELFVQALYTLVVHHSQRGPVGHAAATDYVTRLLALEPWQEEAHRQLMLLLAASGQRAAALTQYELCRQVLAKELGVEPSAETRDIHDLLVKGERLPDNLLISVGWQRESRTVGVCPFRGLAAFREQDAPFFFGREQFTGRLLTAMHQRPLVVLAGSSGSGKSSVVFAGLVSCLRSAGDWRLADFRPGTQPFQALAAAILPVISPQLTETDRLLEAGRLAEALAGGGLDLGDVLEPVLRRQSQSQHLLLVVDQFEELYTLCSESEVRRRFVDTLLGLAERAGRRREPCLVLLLTMRADFMGQALAYRPFADALQDASLLLGPMDRAELRAAIEKPVEAQGAAFEAGLVQRILNDVGEEPGNLPLLEFALTLLWERHNHGWLTHSGYEEIGGVEGALARHADQVYGSLAETDQIAVRRVFAQLVLPGEGTEDTRRRATRAEVGNEHWGLVQHLADKRLVVTGRDTTGTELVEVVHESLIQGWGQLRDWIEAARAFRTWQERLRVALHQWEADGRDEGSLLRGVPLVEAEGWLAERGGDLSEAEWDFIQAGVALRTQAAAERETQRQRELSAAQQLAEAEHERALQQAKDACRLRRRTAWLGLALILTLLAVGVAVGYWKRSANLATEKAAAANVAEQQAGLATSRELAAAAVNAANQDPELGVLLALEAVKAGDTVEAANALHATLPGLHLMHTWPYAALCFGADLTGDLRRVALLNLDGSVTIWQLPASLLTDIAEMQLVATLTTPSPVTYCRLGQDGARLLITRVGEDGSYVAEVWDVPAQKLLFALPQGASSVVCLTEASPDMKLVATLPCDSVEMTLWEVSSGSQLFTWSTGHAPIHSTNNPTWYGIDYFVFNADGTRLVTAGIDGTVRVWDTATGQAQFILMGHDGQVLAAEFAPDGQRLATCGWDNTIRIWDLTPGANAGKEIVHIERDNSVVGVAFSPDGERLATGTLDGAIELWDALDGGLLLSLKGNPGGGGLLVFTSDGEHLFSQANDSQTRLWDLSPDHELLTLLAPVAIPRFSPDGAIVAAGTGDGRALLWDSQTGELLHSLTGNADLTFLAFSPDGIRLATTSWDGTGKLWDAHSGAELVELPNNGDTLWFPAFSPDGRRLAAGTGSGAIKIWDAATGQEMLTLRGHTEAAYGVAFSPDGRLLASGSWDNTSRLWDATTGEQLAMLPHEGDAFWVDFSPDGSRLATTERNGTVQIFDITSLPPREVLTLKGHTSAVLAVVFSPDGRLLATGSMDGTVRLWNAASGQELLNLGLHTDGVISVSFSPDGSRLVSGGWDGTARVYALRLEELVTLAQQRLTRSLTDEECRRYLHVEACPATP